MEQLITPLTTLGHLAQLAPEQFAAPLKSLVANFIVKDLLMNDKVQSSAKERQGFYRFLRHISTQQHCPDVAKHFAFNRPCVVAHGTEGVVCLVCLDAR